MKQQSQKEQQQNQGQNARERDKILGETVPALVEEIVGRTGFRGEITQVKARLLQGDEKGKVMRRNIKGPIRLKDVLMLRETQIEARKLKTGVMKGAFT